MALLAQPKFIDKNAHADESAKRRFTGLEVKSDFPQYKISSFKNNDGLQIKILTSKNLLNFCDIFGLDELLYPWLVSQKLLLSNEAVIVTPMGSKPNWFTIDCQSKNTEERSESSDLEPLVRFEVAPLSRLKLELDWKYTKIPPYPCLGKISISQNSNSQVFKCVYQGNVKKRAQRHQTLGLENAILGILQKDMMASFMSMFPVSR